MEQIRSDVMLKGDWEWESIAHAFATLYDIHLYSMVENEV